MEEADMSEAMKDSKHGIMIATQDELGLMSSADKKKFYGQFS